MMDIEREIKELASWRWDRKVCNDDYTQMILDLCARVRDEALSSLEKRECPGVQCYVRRTAKLDDFKNTCRVCNGTGHIYVEVKP